jgi:hypothetical protein
MSHNGKYLAAACTLPNSKTVIKLFNLEKGNCLILINIVGILLAKFYKETEQLPN